MKTGCDHESQLASPSASFSISQLLDRQFSISVASIVTATGASRNIVKATLSRPIDEGLLARHGAGRSVHYTER